MKVSLRRTNGELKRPYDMNNRYVIGYYPTNKTHDGKRRTIKIEVRGHPEFVVWGRKVYFAPVQ